MTGTLTESDKKRLPPIDPNRVGPGGCKSYNLKHGMERTCEYRAWAAMLQRCINPGNKAYPAYGGRGIRVCDRWREFVNFYLDLGPRPSHGYSIDRYPDNNGNYEPGNVRWADVKQQNRNTRSNRLVTFNGETMCLAAWAERLHVSSRLIRQRIDDYGWTLEEALSEPKRQWTKISEKS